LARDFTRNWSFEMRLPDHRARFFSRKKRLWGKDFALKRKASAKVVKKALMSPAGNHKFYSFRVAQMIRQASGRGGVDTKVGISLIVALPTGKAPTDGTYTGRLLVHTILPTLPDR
jgi:hypothetical protein